MGRKDFDLDSNAEVEGKELAGFLPEEEDPDDIEVLGFATMSTVGELTVPRDYLIPRMKELGLPERMRPNKPSPNSAFKRAVKEHRLIETEENQVNGYRVQHDIRKGDTKTHHLTSEIYIPREEVLDERGLTEEEAEEMEEDISGEWRQTELGLLKFEDDDIIPVPKVDREHPLFDEWQRLSGKAELLFENLQSAHVGYDFQVLTYHLRKHWTKSVPLRDGGAVAFIPAQHSETLEALHTLFKEVNQEYKDRGKAIHMTTIPVLDLPQQKELVQERAEQQLEETLLDTMDDVEELLSESVPVDEILDEVSETIEESEDFAGQYNTLLDAELSVRRLLEDWRNEMEGEMREVVDELVERHTDEEVVAADGGIRTEEVGGGWYEVYEGEEVVDKVQGEEAAEERVEELR